MRLLVCGTERIGDAVMSLPAVQALSRMGWEMTLLAPGISSGIYSRSGVPVVVLPVPAGGFALLRFFFGLRKRGFDRAVLLSGGFVWALGAKLACIPERIGLDSDGRGFLLTSRVRLEAEQLHQSRSYLQVVDASFAGAAAHLQGDPVPALQLHGEELSWAESYLKEQSGFSRYFCVSPGASSRGKRWPLQRFVRVCRQLTSKGLGCIVLGGGADAELASRLAEETGALSCSAAGVSLGRSLALLAGAAFYIGNNSGLAHAAAALRVPGVCLSGPSNPAKTAPLGAPFFMLGGSGVTGRESFFHPHKILLQITPEQVLALVGQAFLQ